MNWKTIYNYLFNRKAIPNPKELNIANLINFTKGTIRATAAKFDIVSKDVLERADKRMKEIKKNSPECFKLGKCIHCHCDLNELVLGDDPCSHSNTDKPCFT